MRQVAVSGVARSIIDACGLRVGAAKPPTGAALYHPVLSPQLIYKPCTAYHYLQRAFNILKSCIAPRHGQVSSVARTCAIS